MEITVFDPNTRDQKLDSAVQLALDHAQRTREGILVTQESYSNYTVSTSSEVPYGLIRERHAAT